MNYSIRTGLEENVPQSFHKLSFYFKSNFQWEIKEDFFLSCLLLEKNIWSLFEILFNGYMGGEVLLFPSGCFSH